MVCCRSCNHYLTFSDASQACGVDFVYVRMPGPHGQLDVLKAGWDECRAQDDQKHLLIEVWRAAETSVHQYADLLIIVQNLFAYIKDLSETLSETKSELCDKKDVIKLIRDRVDLFEKEKSSSPPGEGERICDSDGSLRL